MKIIYKVPIDKYFYTIKIKYSVNNKYELYKRTQIIYGKFVDEHTFEYKVIHNGKIQDDGFVKHCRKSDLLINVDDQIYMFQTYEEAKKHNDIIKSELLKVPMKYTDKESIDKMLEILNKK